MINRVLQSEIKNRMADNKVIVLLGPRQVGKTTLLKTITLNNKNVLWWNGDDLSIRTELEKQSLEVIKKLIGSAQTLVIDEAQRILNIGLILKLIHDNIPDVKVLATGSSAFELANKINEPLTGRKWEYYLYPLSVAELYNDWGYLKQVNLLEHQMVYGMYPEVVNQAGNEEKVLQEIANAYLYKDILTWERIQKPDKLEKLLQALAFQIGNEVSYNELSQLVGINAETIEHYINLLEKAFIVFRIGSFSRNLRNELKKSRKIYFYDNGLRNAIIKQFSSLSLRNDTGALWENFIMSERIKYCEYKRINLNRYFWRNHAQNEIDLIEERNGELHAFEFKWNEKKKFKFPKSFIDNYFPSKTEIINKDNYLNFVT